MNSRQRFREQVRIAMPPLLVSLACAALAGLAAPDTAAAQEQRAPCEAPEYRAFDFWLGSWEVRNPAGEVVGRNEITSVIGGCALHERWEGTGGGTGQSLNAYDHRTNSWHQTWVGGRGLVLRLEGGLRDGAMRLEGEITEGEDTILQRITWTPSPDGSVNQNWETSGDGGKTWATAFDGTYRKVESD